MSNAVCGRAPSSMKTFWLFGGFCKYEYRGSQPDHVLLSLKGGPIFPPYNGLCVPDPLIFQILIDVHTEIHFPSSAGA